MTKERERAGTVLAVASLHKEQDACREDGTETPGSPRVAKATRCVSHAGNIQRPATGQRAGWMLSAERVAWIQTILVTRLELAQGPGTQDGGRLTVYRKLDLFLWG